MADQASVSRQNGSNNYASPLTVVGNIADFGNDIATLAELQAKLAAPRRQGCRGEGLHAAHQPWRGRGSGRGEPPSYPHRTGRPDRLVHQAVQRCLATDRRPGAPSAIAASSALIGLERLHRQPDQLSEVERRVYPEPFAGSGPSWSIAAGAVESARFDRKTSSFAVSASAALTGLLINRRARLGRSLDAAVLASLGRRGIALGPIIRVKHSRGVVSSG